MSLQSRFPKLAFLRQRQPKLEEIEGLLDLFPQACLLIDLQENQIRIANARATELLAFTRTELASSEPEKLFPDYKKIFREGLLNKNSKILKTRCITHNGNPIDVILTLNFIDSLRSWALASLEPVVLHQLQQSERLRLSQRLEDLYALSQAGQKQDLEQALQTALESSQSLTGSSTLAIYLFEPKDPHLIRKVTWGNFQKLPEKIPATDISLLLEPALWIPGKRASASLHQAARAANYAFLGSAPLGESGAFVGLVVAADPKSAPPADLMPLLKVVAANLSGMIQHYTLTSHLLDQQNEQVQHLTTGATIRDNIQESVITLGNDLKILEINPHAEWALGYASQEVSGQPVDNVLIGVENLIPSLQMAQEGIPTHNLGNVRLHRRDGEPFLAHMKILPVPQDKHPERIVILIRDLSEHEQFRVRNQQLEQRALLGEVTAIFAHEVRNQMNSISTGLQLLAINLPKDDPNQELISRLDNECNRVNQLMTSALAFSKPVENTMVPVDMGLLINRLLERWRPRLVRDKIQHHVEISAEDPSVMGDARTLEQVFNNLISNAVDAMSGRNGSLTIHIHTVRDAADRDQLEISVSDNGPGIPREDWERIFDPFFSTSRNGTGLGLAIAKRIITAHRGTISVTSVPGGTVFLVRLPTTAAYKPTNKEEVT